MAALRWASCCPVIFWTSLLTAIAPSVSQQSVTTTAGHALGQKLEQSSRPKPQIQTQQPLPLKRATYSLPLSSFECVYDDGKTEHRVCIFKDIVLWEGQLLYVAKGGELLPDIDINWLEQGRLNLQVIQHDALPPAWGTAQVDLVPQALLGHQVNYANYYHVFIETLPTWHNIMCKYLKLCEYDKGSKLQLWLLEDRGPGAYTDLNFRLPALGPLYACLTPTPPRHIKEERNLGKVTVFKQAIVGLGPDVRAFHQWRPRFYQNWVAPPAEMMHSWRHRLAQCLDTPFDIATAPMKPAVVTIVDRPYKVGRHILNVQELQARIMAKWSDAVVRVVHVEGMDLKQQIALFQHTSIVIWTHGAAMADLLFLPKGAGAIELVPWPHADQAHEWSQSIQSDFSLDIQVAWTRLSDVSHLHYHTEVLFKEPMWQSLGAEDRLSFLERGVCPDNPNTPLNLVCRNEWMHYLVSYVQPWEPVDVLLDTVYTFVQSQGSHFQTA